MLWIATCPHETVQVLEEELKALGIAERKPFHRGVFFDCDLELAYRAHLLLRTASRIQRVLGQFPAADLTQFQTGLASIAWANALRSHKPFTVRPALSDEQARALGEEPVIQAVAQSIQQSPFEKTPPRLDSEAEDAITLVPFFRDGVCVIGVDTAGRALHKRGWRTNGHPAVLKETLAASMLMLAGYTGDEPLLDPMCGSGTIVIEAAYIALGKAPLIHRGKDDFALEHLAGFDRALWRKVSDQLRAQKKSQLSAPIFASDMKAEYVELAKKGALRARVEKYIQFSVSRFEDLAAPASSGLLIANLPYGERIGAHAKLYDDLGKILRARYSNWRVALLVPETAPVERLNLRRAKEITLKNGALPVRLVLGS